jgi:hypothetical protein
MYTTFLNGEKTLVALWITQSMLMIFKYRDDSIFSNWKQNYLTKNGLGLLLAAPSTALSLIADGDICLPKWGHPP